MLIPSETTHECHPLLLQVGDAVQYHGMVSHPLGWVVGIDRYKNQVNGETIEWTSYTISSEPNSDQNPLSLMQTGARWWLTNKPGIGLMEWVWRGDAEAISSEAYTSFTGDISLPNDATKIRPFSGQVMTSFEGDKGVSTDVATLLTVLNPDEPDEWLATEEFVYKSTQKKGLLSFRARKVDLSKIKWERADSSSPA